MTTSAQLISLGVLAGLFACAEPDDETAAPTPPGRYAYLGSGYEISSARGALMNKRASDKSPVSPHGQAEDEDERLVLRERITELEVSLTYQQQLSKDLDDVIQALHVTIERLERRIDRLERMESEPSDHSS